jgi:hypothetical protein
MGGDKTVHRTVLSPPINNSGKAGTSSAQGIEVEIPQYRHSGMRNWSGKPGFAQQNAPKKRKYKANTASSRVCKALFST